MTAQIRERLIRDGETLALASTPLAQYLFLADVDLGFTATSSALWRGYIGTWEIAAGRLYLLRLEGELADGSELTVERLFPGFPDRVFAHWFTGELCAPQGKLLNYRHMGFGSTFERDLLLQVERGVVVAETVRENGQALPGAPDAQQSAIAAFTTFGAAGKRGRS